jgi:UDP-glucose 4-epimerase
VDLAGARVLVTGGAGYIGSVVVDALVEAGAARVVVLDDLRSGHAAAVHPLAALVRGDIGDAPLVAEVCATERIGAAIHLAASSIVGDSMRDPAAYYENNVARSLRLLDALCAERVERVVFSSSAAVYGGAGGAPLTEEAPARPESCYGETKLAIERALHWYAAAGRLRSASLRYFNAAGATERRGEAHHPETHLIPLVLEVARGRSPHLTVYGDDYPIPGGDGSCVRDYIHVADLARAHLLALSALDHRTEALYNLGSGGGESVKRVIDVAREVTGHPIPVVVGPRRAGDPAVLVASSERIQRELGWGAAPGGLPRIVEDAWRR